jgi:hypothetical protein
LKIFLVSSGFPSFLLFDTSSCVRACSVSPSPTFSYCGPLSSVNLPFTRVTFRYFLFASKYVKGLSFYIIRPLFVGVDVELCLNSFISLPLLFLVIVIIPVSDSSQKRGLIS